MTMKACTKCKLITHEDKCPICDALTSTNWSGLVIIVDPDKSDIATELGINIPGEYALRVR